MGERSWAQRKIILRVNSILILSTLPESIPEASLKLRWTGTLNSRNSEVTINVLCGLFYYNSNCKRSNSIVSALKPRIESRLLFVYFKSTCHFVRQFHKGDSFVGNHSNTFPPVSISPPPFIFPTKDAMFHAAWAFQIWIEPRNEKTTVLNGVMNEFFF